MRENQKRKHSIMFRIKRHSYIFRLKEEAFTSDFKLLDGLFHNFIALLKKDVGRCGVNLIAEKDSETCCHNSCSYVF